MRPNEDAGRSLGGNRDTAEDATHSTPSIGHPAAERKLPNFGRCIACGAHIRLAGTTTTCPTCSAWRRWASAFRIAVRALRGPQ